MGGSVRWVNQREYTLLGDNQKDFLVGFWFLVSGFWSIGHKIEEPPTRNTKQYTQMGLPISLIAKQ